uniref:Peptidyl-prolyl cis-trans isomerase n=1 Tax=Strombidium rassoulzadegani TaxID=1082188 RepID=A0A7S3FV41_9SPIT|mmetsp:Transcript_14792/g.25164  ORF Transcript_14792/g.25164 Transcript_14792/m.25164 type:complete len:224 (+) Transcript_14792:29-700(+)
MFVNPLMRRAGFVHQAARVNQINLVNLNQRFIMKNMFGGSQAPAGSYSDPSNPKVYFEISQNTKPIGRMVFELYANHVPKTAENFRSICAGDNKQGFTYSKSHFHRIINGFMAQGGDFTNHNGTGGASIYGRTFPDEPAGLKLMHKQRGLLSMANAGPNTNGSQFFITFCDTPWLNGNHAVFGEMVEGEEVLQILEHNGSQSGTPKAKFVIEKSGELKEEEAA